MMAGGPGFAVKRFEVTADEGRRINENVVVGGVRALSSFFEPGINVPSRGCLVLQCARYVFLAGDIHEQSGRSDVGHIIGKDAGIDLVMDREDRKSTRLNSSH